MTLIPCLKDYGCSVRSMTRCGPMIRWAVFKAWIQESDRLDSEPRNNLAPQEKVSLPKEELRGTREEVPEWNSASCIFKGWVEEDYEGDKKQRSGMDKKLQKNKGAELLP